ncbi:uncharacterized protein [Nicotiana sylvestris]|uniref:Uncharacterized protein n=2 Tax=Nicotiana TaxID=4085 RepID=A0A1S3Z5U1_TOBAC|nr:PREDICTED: uncharacterized protein LOC104231396 [Nicotiana sylvestris]XP_016459719.1 PREDICTED: uncharacterized protein LOC107783262 [Nicotiana tabacum]
MEQESLSRRARFPTYERRFLAVGIGLLAIISPLYIDSRKNTTEPHLEEQTINFLPYLPLLFLITVIMSISISHQLARFSSYDHRLLAIGLTLVAIVSPLYVDRRKVVDPELEEQSLSISSYLPLLMLFLIIAIAMSCYLDGSFTRFDPYWIHRVGGSSTGILILLLVLAFVLKFKAL